LVLALTGSGIALIPGCAGQQPDYPDVPVDGGAIDIHCHLFNGSDLPVTRFLTQVVLTEQEAAAESIETQSTVVDPTVVERLIDLLTRGLLQDTPTAVEETKFLERRAPKMSSGTLKGARQQVIDRTARFLQQSDQPESFTTLSGGEQTLRQQILQAAGSSPEAIAPSTSEGYREVAARAVASNTGIGLLARWVALFFRYRHDLADELAKATRANGREPRLLVPSMVDYAHWLGQDSATGSSLPEQVEAFDHIARRRGQTAVHGMVGFDPLRTVFYRRNKPYQGFASKPFDPVALARNALTVHGFVGLKVYPPMGFKPIGNTDAQGYQQQVIAKLGSVHGLGKDLDKAMAEAFDLCIELDAPILTHARFSIGAGPNYAARADPAYWVDVLNKRQWRNLRLCLAHMGYFRLWNGSTTEGAATDRKTWEWTAGRYIKAHPDSHVYVDISYLTEVLGEGGEARRRAAAKLRQWIGECDPDVRHILYGTDWTMVGREPDFPNYTSEVVKFLRDDCQLNEEQLDRIMMANAVRYLGLNPGEKTRKRLTAFYDRHGLPISRLPGGDAN
jgi:predicted TIM-barrel fold metal-dependent hydrolase